ncbi:MAG TPA: hypothetical protein VGZ52_01440 [Acidimicrobiales bacterium]|nr:hypothetical protein [Acidimicrobiales bacterium]
MSTTPTGISLTCKIFPLAFLMLLFKPVVEIDGAVSEGAWSETFYPVAAGTHHVKVFWKYFWFLPCNNAEMDVPVADGQMARVVYQARWLVFLPGKISLAA